MDEPPHTDSKGERQLLPSFATARNDKPGVIDDCYTAGESWFLDLLDGLTWLQQGKSRHSCCGSITKPFLLCRAKCCGEVVRGDAFFKQQCRRKS